MALEYKNKLSMRGFTLIEIFLVIAIIAVLFAVAFPLSNRYFFSNDLEVTAEKLRGNLTVAQQRSMNSREGSPWSLHIDNQNKLFTVYLGNDWGGRDSAYDMEETWPASISISPAGDIQFSHLSGRADSAYSITISNESSDAVRVVSITAEGGISHD